LLDFPNCVAIANDIRAAVIARAEGRCEYCQTLLAYTPDPPVVDHIVPITLGGPDTSDNLAACCWGCNSHKSAAMRALDPREGRLVALFHPRRQKWSEHFAWSPDGLRILGLTAVGRATLLKMNLSRQGLLNLRAVLNLVGKHPPL
jgi:hypothetical protein